ncbi:double zinc ribbon domain-containing protein, partial [Wolbachia endosymbiont of Drosophila bicornuta]|uniref:double zinc ribbon domain-containing protein n=1 Tax=Wolbachia endosymbiont of Drosophila bicornuta TaxID=375918 RepID=UPI0023A94957
LLLKKATNLIFPSVCVSCECIIDENLNLCSECNKKINFLTKHYCNVCGVVISDNIYTCGKCIINPPPFIALFTIIRTDHNMLLFYHSHKHISYPIRTIARSAIFPTKVRYSGFGLSRNIAAGFFGGLAPFICTTIIKVTGQETSASFYMIFCALIGLVAISQIKGELSSKLPKVNQV